MALDVLEARFKIPIDFGDVDEAIGRVDKLGASFTDTTARTVAMAAASKYAGEVATAVARNMLEMTDVELALARAQFGVVQATDDEDASLVQYDAHVALHIANTRKLAKEEGSAATAIDRVTDKVDKVSQSSGRAGKALNAAGFGFRVLGALAYDAAGGAIPLVERKIKDVTAAVSGFARQVASTALGFGLASAVGSALHSIFELPGKILESAAAAERLDNAFQFTLGSQAEPVLGWIERIASKTQFTEDQLKGMALQMTKVGIPVQDLDKDMAAALDIAARSADPLGAMGSAIDAFAEGARRGVVNMRLLRPLGLGPDALRVLPEFANLNDKQLRKQIEVGNLTADQLRAVIAGADGMLGDIGLKGGKDMASAIKNIKSLPDLLYQEFAKNPAFDVLRNKLNKIYDYFAPGGEGGNKIIEFLGKFGTEVVDQFNNIDIKSVGEGFLDLVKNLPTAISAVSVAVSGIWEILGVAKETIKWIAHYTGLDKKFEEAVYAVDVANSKMAKDQSSQFNDTSGHAAKYRDAWNAGILASNDAATAAGSMGGGATSRRVASVPVGGNNITVHVTTTVHAQNAGSPEEVGHEVSKKLGQTIPGHIHGALDQLGRQGGY